MFPSSNALTDSATAMFRPSALLLVFVSHRQAALAWSETSAKHFYPEGLAQVDVDEWRKV